MPPSVKITKEEIINATVNIVRKNGARAINARTVASSLNCSTQPIFSNFETMDDLRIAVEKRADKIYNDYIIREIESKKFPEYKASGIAYIRFAKEEKELFKLLFMRDRTGEKIPEKIDFGNMIEGIVQSSTGLNSEDAKIFHLEMWAYVHGIATMFATGFLNLDWGIVSKMITDAYKGLRKQYGLE